MHRKFVLLFLLAAACGGNLSQTPFPADFVGTWTCTNLQPESDFDSSETTVTFVDAGPSTVRIATIFPNWINAGGAPAPLNPAEWEDGIVWGNQVVFEENRGADKGLFFTLDAGVAALWGQTSFAGVITGSCTEMQ